MESNKYNISLIRKYLNGELDARAMYELERQAHEDPLLMDIILGMESADQLEHDQALAEIDDLITKRTKPEKTRVVPLVRWSIAASIVIVSGLAALFVLRDKPAGDISAGNQKKRSTITDSVIRPADQDTAEFIDEQVKIAEGTRRAKSPQRTSGENSVAVSKGKQQIAMLHLPEAKDSVLLKEVLVTGYATSKKSSLTGSVTTVKSEELAPQIALQGRVAGVEVGEANSKSIMIRGSSSLETKNKVAGAVQLTGIVRDKISKEALPGVFIKVKGKDIATVTDINGQFKLAVPDSNQTLELAYVGFDKASVKVNNNDSIVIALNPSSAALSEVVVVGYGKKSADEDINSSESREVEPVNGWDHYNKYLKEKAVVSKGQKDGTVVLSFSVSSSGSLSDFKIIKTDSSNLNVQAIKLVIDGPQWRGPKEGTQKVRLRIKFREAED